MRVEVETVLPVPPDEAWRRLLVWEEQVRWMKDADDVRVLTPHREGLGVRLAVSTRVLNVPLFTEVLEVIGWDPPRRLALAHRRFVRGTGEWTLADEDRVTRFTWTEDLRLPGPLLGELALRIYRPFMRRLMGEAVRDLRALLSLPTGD